MTEPDTVTYDETHDIAMDRMSKPRWVAISLLLVVLSATVSWAILANVPSAPTWLALPSTAIMVPVSAFIGAFIEYATVRILVLNEVEVEFE